MKYLLIYIFILIPFKSYSQYDDFGVWSSIGVNYKLIKNFEISYKLGYRTEENSRYTKNVLNELSLSYELFKYAEFGLEYRHSFSRELNNTYRKENRLAPNLSLKYKINKDLDLDLRTQYQYELSRNDNSNPENLIVDPLFFNGYFQSENTLRFRPRIKYELNKKSKISFSYETFIEFSNIANFLNRERYTFEYSRELSKNSDIEISYLYQFQKNTTNPRSDNVINISYSYDLEFNNQE